METLPQPIYVTRPLLPPLGDYTRRLEGIWEKRWLTNHGDEHRELELALSRHLRAPHLTLFTNGTIAWLIGLKALGVDGGEAIVTPFTFPATVHALTWLGVTPVFADIDPVTMNLDSRALEALITPKTRAILGVHVYGTPCDVAGIQSVADRHGLRVAYDGAHAFGVELAGRPIGDFGDLTMFSFHATKLFNTAEGGCLVYRDATLRDRIRLLHNFGIHNEEEITIPGLNGKMSELQAAFGLAVLPYVEDEWTKRGARAARYRTGLAGEPGITCPLETPDVKPSRQYFAIRVNREEFGASRDEVWQALRNRGVHARKYFYPLCSEYPCYRDLPSAARDRLPVANRIAKEVLALPLYGDLGDHEVDLITDTILKVGRRDS
jgi:dTDP-4-amino-4,6-dideoxygalactose transaminase